MRNVLLFLAAVLVGAACASPETEAPMPAEDSALSRPDPSNTAGLPENEVPPDWVARFDHDADYAIGANADSSDVYFVTMTPGWHVTTKPAGIFWHPASSAQGSFTASTRIHLFQPGDRNEGLGLFLGGADLQGPGQTYLYFLVRRSGEFLVKRRVGEETESLIDWTASPAVVPFDETTEGTASNTLTVQVDDSTIRFLVNDTEVATLPKEGLETDGIVGLRLNHGLNVHVEGFSVEMAAGTSE